MTQEIIDQTALQIRSMLTGFTDDEVLTVLFKLYPKNNADGLQSRLRCNGDSRSVEIYKQIKPWPYLLLL